MVNRPLSQIALRYALRNALVKYPEFTTIAAIYNHRETKP